MANRKIGVITGDIVNSTKVSPELWLQQLKVVLQLNGNEPKDWEIYRGDQFQLVTDVSKVLDAALMLRASLNTIKLLDVRMGIGIGLVDYDTSKVTQSNGEAFVNSGAAFDNLNKRKWAIQSSDYEFDRVANIILMLLDDNIATWSPLTSDIVYHTLTNANLTQSEIAKLIGIKQSNVSIGLKRSKYNHIAEAINFLNEQIKTL